MLPSRVWDFVISWNDGYCHSIHYTPQHHYHHNQRLVLNTFACHVHISPFGTFLWILDSRLRQYIQPGSLVGCYLIWSKKWVCRSKQMHDTWLSILDRAYKMKPVARSSSIFDASVTNDEKMVVAAAKYRWYSVSRRREVTIDDWTPKETCVSNEKFCDIWTLITYMVFITVELFNNLYFTTVL